MNSTERRQRREFLTRLSLLSASAYVAPCRVTLGDAAVVSNDKSHPNVTHGVSSGDVSFNAATIWSRADRASRMLVSYSTREDFSGATTKTVRGPVVLKSSDYTGKLVLRNLPAGEDLFYRVQFQDLDHIKTVGAPVTGRLSTASKETANVKFAWSGDTAGQGFGIDEARGGMQTYEMIRQERPDFLVHSGDVCYSDGPFPSELKLDDGTTWNNITTEATSKVAESLDEFRANFQYNLLDRRVRQCNAEVPLLAQWDDHETTNNWYPGEMLLNDDCYTVKSASLLAARAKQAFFEYLPIRPNHMQRIHRAIKRGPLLDLFFLDLRSFRGPNTSNRQERTSDETAFLGAAQLRFIKQQLRTSKATWKFICSDMPIGLVVGDGDKFENGANGDGPALGRELEIADLLRFIKRQNIQNVVFITADVHYAASHYYDPSHAQFSDFLPFWEFVSGPLHAGTFGPGKLDNTFGPQVKYTSIPADMKQNRPPSEGLQFYGLVNIDAQTKVATVQHKNRDGKLLWTVDLQPST